VKGLPKEQCATRDFPVSFHKAGRKGMQIPTFACVAYLEGNPVPEMWISRLQLHKSFLCRFRIDAKFFRAQALGAERKDCDCRSTFSGAQCAMALARARHSRIAIDPVETGFPGAGTSREMQS
jgi:hypothetical protein